VKQYLSGFQKSGQPRCFSRPAEKFNPYRCVNKSHLLVTGNRRRGGALALGIVPASSAKRRRALCSTRVRRANSMTAVLPLIPVARWAFSRSSASRSSVVRIHIHMHILYAQVKPADPRDKQPPSRKRRAEGRLEALDRRIGNAALPRPRSRKPRPGAGHAVSAEARPTLRV